jgi:hypothetical protein
VDAVATINDRIGQIQLRIAELNGYPQRAQAALLNPPAGVLGSPDVRAPSSAVAFDAALERAMATGASTTGTPTTDAVGSGKDRVNAKGVPVELVPYGNGTVPAEALSGIAGSNHALWAPAARSFEALRDAASRDGVTIGITDSYRTYATQVDLVARKGLYSQGGLAAAPGTSNHGWGMAVDLALDPAAQAWMRTNAGRYGFVEDTPREPWHWGYHPTH